MPVDKAGARPEPLSGSSGHGDNTAERVSAVLEAPMQSDENEGPRIGAEIKGFLPGLVVVALVSFLICPLLKFDRSTGHGIGLIAGAITWARVASRRIR